MRLHALYAAVVVVTLCAPAARAQRHDGGSSPPTAPPPKPVMPAQTITPLSTALGAIQFSAANASVSAPQDLLLELQSSDDRLRTAALAALGAPAQYTARGHVGAPHSVHLDYVSLGETEELDAILTVELDQHLLSAILMPENQEWHRIATVLYATAFSDHATTPSTFLRTDRSLLEPLHYTAIFRATVTTTNGSYSESEAHLRILNGRATVTLSFASAERVCDATPQRSCEVIERWLQADAADAARRFLLVTATGHVKLNETGDPIASAETFETAHLRTFSCQPLMFSATSQHFEPTANAAPCFVPPAVQASSAPHPAATIQHPK
jgi:hypothetical protein